MKWLDQIAYMCPVQHALYACFLFLQHQSHKARMGVCSTHFHILYDLIRLLLLIDSQKDDIRSITKASKNSQCFPRRATGDDLMTSITEAGREQCLYDS